MIAVNASGVLSGELAPGTAAYADRDWVDARSPGEVPVLLGDGDGDGAGAALAEVARAAAAVVRDVEGPVEVVGEGIVAHAIRHLVGTAGGDGRPAAIVDASGDPDAIAAATRRVADLGTVVLAGEARGRPVPVELYPDVHLRGLRVVAVAAARADAEGDPPEEFRQALRVAKLGEVPPADGLWLRIEP